VHGVLSATRQAAMDEVMDWMTFYNRCCWHSTTGHVTPMRFEDTWLAKKVWQAA
jgi:hypothetical protein